MNSTDSSVQEPPDYVPQMQLSLDLLAASQRLHNARMSLARCRAALDAWPLELEWRRCYALAADDLDEAVRTYDGLVRQVRWLEWGLIQREGP